LYVKDQNTGESVEKLARGAFSDWSPTVAVVETKQLRAPGALVEVEAIGVLRPLRPRR
jgi:enamine deaminase RidA (YjgF/YER057c/UK114 family)